MKKALLSIITLFSVFWSAQTFTQAYQDRANQITQTNINTYLTEFASYGVKKTGSVANANALAWLKNKYASFGYTASQIVEDPWTGGGYTSKNLVITKTGTLYPTKFVIVCGHFDTIAGPGVNDNGSGTSIILEIARILKDVPTDYSIKFINFSGEEQGLYGSQHYVQNVVNATTPKMDIKVVFNIDEVGGVAGMVNDTVFCDRDQSSPSSNNSASQAITQQLANCVGLYSPLFTEFDPAYASDYVPFQQNGEIITGFYEHNISNYPHTANDTYVNMDPVYVFNVGKAALGAVQHFAGASTITLAVDCPPERMLESLKISPNPAKNFVQIEMVNLNRKDFSFTISDLSGRTIIATKNESRIDVSKLENGVYLGTMSVEDQKVTKKIIIKK
ncbi:M28 family peptidase [Kaistella sp. 97-N-M2]|uniref:M28 family peptidase n=1 Tax=Kaistella sp. 97-N-M2 TaxID=2908645 RepID=UPI001F1D739F|nr:M28 family peptidase [Kaistella sp. 97-N-M2]UJF29250.1 M28 family peptidase [Kaistella sp. 97-N-M2]